MDRGYGRQMKCPEFWLVMSRMLPFLLLIMLLPFIIDIISLSKSEGGPSRFDLRFHFRKNMHGENIYMGKVASQKMTRNPEGGKVSAAIVVLARDDDIEDVLLSLGRMEKHFNHKYLYDYVFLNNNDFNYNFRDRTSRATKARCLYGRIPEEHWSYPSWVSPQEAAVARKEMRERGVLYGSRESYHHMCRYFSGFIHKHPLLKEYDYYWRMEPDVHYYCDLDYDPFLYMQENQLKYGFVITILELANTIPSLWGMAQQFMRENPKLIPEKNLMPLVTAADGSYNLCHFWSNFEIGDLNFFRSKAYQAYFDYLDGTGGFFLERWGDAPVHSLAVAMLLNSSQVHFFQDIGYRHNSMKHCPATQRNNCDCDAIEAVMFHKPSFGVCHKRWEDLLAAGG